ncbi:SDR family oxidoreductase [Lactiplantibacillus mudanjiangensis]|uniref:Oxidoreductase [Lactobacillus allii] n=1 Tax=Lactiplantibacillus mudanjiangensis TaxID=1296538 RepID=A0A660DY57_9LACO|nr:SDR family oxidoreductase [Lactiplantibacillus mudanjiangensis]VDG24942.1 oxidoreductase [Lactobacillus allii] [Lactiplantibacillus mudanjiangensis]VDG28175.1 oxidoreductase [Lactobacillus allii] [Lactiplantibacillus mudanjiangensis]
MKSLIVITGASSGFGAAMAKLFNANDYPLLLLGRRVEKIEALNLTGDVMIKKADVTDQVQLGSAIKAAEAKYGPTDLLINNAGLMLLGNVWQQSPTEWQTMLDTNVMGVLNGMQLVLPQMTERHHGTIINISSIAGYKAFQNHAAYVASKFGVHGLSETVRQEVADKQVRVMLVAPGAAETELLTHVTDDHALTEYEAWKETMGGLTLDPKHVAETVKFMYEMPQEVNIREVDIAATRQDS